jgi:hypothetical protein
VRLFWGLVRTCYRYTFIKHGLVKFSVIQAVVCFNYFAYGVDLLREELASLGVLDKLLQLLVFVKGCLHQFLAVRGQHGLGFWLDIYNR